MFKVGDKVIYRSIEEIKKVHLGRSHSPDFADQYIERIIIPKRAGKVWTVKDLHPSFEVLILKHQEEIAKPYRGEIRKLSELLNEQRKETEND